MIFFYFGIYGEDEVDYINLRGKRAVLIRIGATCELKTSNLYQDILYLEIEDITLDCKLDDFKRYIVFEFSKLNDFILNNDFDEVIVHCALGLSRSPAIMICIARIIGSLELENMIKAKFNTYNKVILKEFINYPYIGKRIEVDNITFIGHFIDKELVRQIEELFYINEGNDLNKIKLRKVKNKTLDK